jgi:hypothetical protein
MDRGVPTEEVLSQMRTADPPVRYLVGTPKGRLTKLEKELVDKPWRQARLGVQVKLLPTDDELFVQSGLCEVAIRDAATCAPATSHNPPDSRDALHRHRVGRAVEGQAK